MTTALSVMLTSIKSNGESLVPSTLEIEAYARAQVRRRYLDASRLWRRPAIGTFNLLVLAAFAFLPLVPGSEEFVGVPLWLSLLLAGVNALILLAATAACIKAGPDSRAYEILTTLESGTWCSASVILIARSGNSISIYWLMLVALIALSVTTLHRNRVLSVELILCILVLGLAFAWQEAWSDMYASIAFGAMLLWFQRSVTETGWQAERERARAELLSERVGRVQVEAERSRMARELHDGVAAELTSVLWQAQGLATVDTKQIQELVKRVRVCISEVRLVSHPKGKPRTAIDLVEETERVSRAMIADATGFTFDSNLCEPDLELTADVCNHTLRIVQECVRNALTHASAEIVSVRMQLAKAPLSGHRISLSVSDDGIGLQHAQVGRGRKNVEERASMLGGKAHWGPNGHKGTNAVVEFPISGSTLDTVTSPTTHCVIEPTV